MRPQFEKVTFGSAPFVVIERVYREFPMYWHYHPEFQLTLIVDSQGQRLVGDDIANYGRRDLVLLGPNLPHTWRSDLLRSRKDRRHRAVDVQFRSNFLGEQFFNIKEMRPILDLLRRSASGLAFGHTRTGRAVAETMVQFPSLSPSRRFLMLLNVLLELAMDSNGKLLSTDFSRPVCRIEDQERIEMICSYLKNHFDQESDYSVVAGT